MATSKLFKVTGQVGRLRTQPKTSILSVRLATLALHAPLQTFVTYSSADACAQRQHRFDSLAKAKQSIFDVAKAQFHSNVEAKLDASVGGLMTDASTVTDTREVSVYRAKLADHAERYEGELFQASSFFFHPRHTNVFGAKRCSRT